MSGTERGWLDEIAAWRTEVPVCRWCGKQVYEGKTRHAWHHQSTGSTICSGQLIGAWTDLRRAEPVVWKDV